MSKPEEKRESWKRCKLCKSLVPVQYMAIKAVPAENGYWKPRDADWCGRCAENRAEGVKDEDGDHKSIGKQFAIRLSEGFQLLTRHGRFGLPAVEDGRDIKED